MFKNKVAVLSGVIFLAIVAYGFYEKNRRIELLYNFKHNKLIQCDDIKLKMSYGWAISRNRFFTNGKIFKTIIWCKSINN